jgi:ribonuclease Z
VLRNTLSLKAAEIPDFEPLVEAIPVFTDDNITVFSIPIVPTPHHRCEIPAESDALSNLSENILKRKRESSLELPLKRPFLGSTVPATDGPSTLSMSSTLLDRFLSNPNFDPAALEGDEADAWRQLVIEHMFTWMEPPSRPQLPPKTNKKGKRERDAGDTETKSQEAHSSQAILTSPPQVPPWVEGASKCQEKPPRRGPKEASPSGSLKPLPTFTPPVREASTAYIVVGPHVRGKFDVKRAEELGLHGPLRGRVARGETVTFTMDDGTGAKMQRTVKPEDCVGENETTRVRLSHFSALVTVLKLGFKAVIILDVPTPDHIESLVSAFATPAYSPFRVKNPTHKDYAVHVIYHLLGSNVLEDERYKSFMSGFSDDTQHLICSPDHNPDRLTFTSAGLSQLRLNQLDSEMFPLLHHRATPQKDLSCAFRSFRLFDCLTDSCSLHQWSPGFLPRAPICTHTAMSISAHQDAF